MIKIIKYTKGLVLTDEHVYIGRRWAHFEASKWGNPYKVGKNGTLEEVCEKYKQYVLSRPDLIEALPELKGKTLVCWCGGKEVGKLCHGDILKELVENLGA